MKGVSYHKATGKYEAYVMKDKKKLYLGVFNDVAPAWGAVQGAQKVLAKCQ